MNKIKNKLDLVNYINEGNPVKYLFFWGHKPNWYGSIDKSCLSQWYDSPFEVNGVIYPTAEHYMMSEKARLFNDHNILEAIQQSVHPGEAKKLGRKVQGFENKIWCQERENIVIQGNYAKFSQHPHLKQFLVQTKSRILVEASPYDQIWGIGLSVDDTRAENPYDWKGLNLLGFALMAVREQLIIRD
jgi:ribA/ribD-fused uncharacterized protein